MKQSPEVIRDWFEQIEIMAQDKLTKWEADFVESVRGQFEISGRISDRQEEILERIYADKT